jgi:hypothetical protein
MATWKYGTAGIFDSEEKILQAASKVKSLGFSSFEAISPYPIHGMEEAAGIKRSWIPYVTFVMGLTGLLSALLLTWWTSAVDWPLNIGGKPFFSLPAFIPIVFELTVLFAAHCSVGALLVACGIPKIDPPVIDPDLTCSKFAIFIPNTDRGRSGDYDESKVSELFRSLGAIEVKKTEF